MSIIKSILAFINRKIDLSINKLDYTISQNESVLTHLKALKVHEKTFSKYCQYYKNKDIALIASGPTIKYAKHRDEMIYVGVNGAYKNDFTKLDYIFIQDNSYMVKEINRYLPEYCKKFYGIIPQSRCRNVPKLRPISIFDIQDANASVYYLEDMVNHNWPNNIALEPLRDNIGSVFSAMQFILYTHPKNIYLYGCDCTTNTHFYDEKSRPTDLSYQLTNWQYLKEHVNRNYNDINIISVNPIGLRGVFIDKYTPEFIEDNPELQNATDNMLL